MSAGQIQLFDPRGQYERMRADIDARVQKVLSDGRYVLGPEVAELETALAAATGAPHAITVANGTDALTIALVAARIGYGDAVFLPSFTFVATAGAVLAAGAKPVFCDVDAATLTLDPDDLARRIADCTDLRPRAVIPVDLFGLPADYARIAEVADAHDLLILADAAQSYGARQHDRTVGAIAPVTATSFYPTKPLGCFGDGGAVFVHDDALASRIRIMRSQGSDDVPGHNSRLDTLQATILLAKLDGVEADRTRRAAIAAHYDAAFSDTFDLQIAPPAHVSAHAVYAIFSPERDKIHATLADNGIASRAYYATPTHLLPAYSGYSQGPGSLPVTESLSTRILALPMHAELSDADADRVCETTLRAIRTA